MKESILLTVKKMLGLTPEYEVFDLDIIMHINSAFSVLTQLGIGPSEGFFIKDANDLWSDFIQSPKLEMVKTYVYLKVRLMFDPPSSSAVMESMNRQISEFEWRLNVAAEENIP